MYAFLKYFKDFITIFIKLQYSFQTHTTEKKHQILFVHIKIYRRITKDPNVNIKSQ